MRSIWFLILFGSLITYHCLTTVSGEKPSTQAAAKKPSFTQCKKYVDAALSSAEARKKAGIVGGKPPDGSDTDATEEDPNATEEDPNATEEDETDATEEDPNATEEDPNATEEDECDATEEDPNATEEDPNATEEDETDATEEDPNATEEDPNATEEDETDATEEDPNATEEDPNATEEEETDATEEDPNATEEDPNATEEDETDATEEDPNATEEDPNATEEEETDATEEDPNATEEDPNATEEDETDATEEDPNATEEDPNATEEEETDATEEDPNATEEDPNATEEDETDATEEDPNATEEDPNATEEEETDATEEDPNATEEDPNATEEEETDATEEDPNATEEDPNATEEEETDATEEDPNATEEDPNATEEEETDATEEDPNATEEDPNATEEEETDATEEDPNATEEDPNATEEEETDATEEDPNATEEDPNATEEEETDATEEDPNATEEDPNATEEEETDATEEDPNATEEDPNATEESESSEHSGGEVTSEEDQKSDEDDKSANGNAKKDSGKKAKSNGPLPGHVASKAHQSQSGKSQTDKTAQKARASAKDAVSPEAEDGVSDEDEDDEEEDEEAEPYEPRSRDHINQILGLDDSDQTKTTFNMLDKVTQATLKELKNTYENAIKPLEQLYKYRDLSNRHFGDPEIFSKPLIVFMGPWSGGKSTIINWLLGIQHEEHALRTGADPSPAQFNIMMYGKEAEKLDGTQLAADWTFSGLQKFGQSFLDRLRGQKLPNRLLEKVNIVEIPGILEVRKQVERSFPFNDACQWFIDRADTLFLIYDPAKLDIGPETEAILDQLKGRESQVRIVLNKADTVKPDELLRVQAMLVWNISPLMSSAEPPVMYAASLWDRPLQVESPKSLLVAHEHNFLKDIRDGIERRVETRIAAARRFAVRVRNHAKMTDCYLNTYLNHKSFFGDRKKITNDILDHPQNYHIYEGLSTLTNISRYDLPDPDTYRDFFRLNPLWDFPTLQSTCSFWRGCPLNKLDIAIAYELPEILGKFRRQRESILVAQKSQKSSKH